MVFDNETQIKLGAHQTSQRVANVVVVSRVSNLQNDSHKDEQRSRKRPPCVSRLPPVSFYR